MPRSISHLNALRAFEAAARHESFTKAADELYVSHSVISKHVRNLEGWLHAPLFVRHKNWVELTDDGRMLAPRIAEGLHTLTDACDAFRHSPRKKVIEVVAEPALSTRWLRRRIVEFQENNPNIEIKLRSAWSPPTRKEGGWDIIIHFEKRISGARRATRRLFPIDGFPACSPEFLQDLPVTDGTINMSTVPLIHDHGHSIWRLWFEKYEPNLPSWQDGQDHTDLSMAIDAAVDGEGVILADNIICEREIDNGTLVKLDDRTVNCAWYCTLIDLNRRASPALKLFQDWLHETADDLYECEGNDS